jgi:hypothetical protein
VSREAPWRKRLRACPICVLSGFIRKTQNVISYRKGCGQVSINVLCLLSKNSPIQHLGSCWKMTRLRAGSSGTEWNHLQWGTVQMQRAPLTTATVWTGQSAETAVLEMRRLTEINHLPKA